ncbi:T-cell surface glycoprotein CD3 epsilon chain-like [Channa argus]|uniref:T-cell surface glycoprotein CD3 epsilon chain-like n=1 Tax=Channa argus TaxID=215402 RepID=UPI0035221982
MKNQLAFSGCLLLLWTLTEFVSTDKVTQEPSIQIKRSGPKFEIVCKDGKQLMKDNNEVNPLLEYRDENSGEYECDSHKIFVKFRTCDNCIEMDLGSIVGMVAGDLVATIVIGVAVYIIASQNGINPTYSQKKSSDRQHLVPNEMSSRGPNDHYERLRTKGGQKDTYDVITNRK